MRIPVECKNCGIKWVRIVSSGTDIEFTHDEQHNCPACGSNYYLALIEEKCGEISQDRLGGFRHH